MSYDETQVPIKRPSRLTNNRSDRNDVDANELPRGPVTKQLSTLARLGRKEPSMLVRRNLSDGIRTSMEQANKWVPAREDTSETMYAETVEGDGEDNNWRRLSNIPAPLFPRRAKEGDPQNETEGWSFRMRRYIFFNGRLSIPFLVACFLLDVTLVCMDFLQEPRFERKANGVPHLSYHMIDHFFYIMSVLSIIGLPMSLLSVGGVFKLVSIQGFITLATHVFQVALFGIHISGAYDVEHFYVPYFMRVWTLRRYFLTLMSVVAGASDSARLTLAYHVMPPLTAFVGTIFTTASLFQLIDTASYGRHLTLVQSLYFMMVTYSTVGYGDITPTTFYTRLAVVFFICIALVQVPQFLATIDVVKRALPKLRQYTGDGMHIIVDGVRTAREMELLLEELFVVTVGTKLVFVIDGEVGQECLKLSTDPRYRQSVVVINGDLHDENVMRRVRVRDARAVLLHSQKGSVSDRGDTHVLFTSTAITQHDPAIPQYHWLRFGTHAFLTPHAFTISRERFTGAILSLAAILPGVIPFMCNLIKSPCVDERGGGIAHMALTLGRRQYKETDDEWYHLYEDSRLCHLHLMGVPRSLVGMSYPEAAITVLNHCQLTVVGVVRSDIMVLNPSRDIPEDMKWCAPKSRGVASQRDASLLIRPDDSILVIGPPNCEIVIDGQKAGHQTGVSPATAKTPAESMPSRGLLATPSTISTPQGKDEYDGLGEGSPMEETIRLEDAAHLSDNEDEEESFLLVDVPTTESGCNYTDNERAVNEQLMVRKLVLMMQTLKAAHRRCRIKILSPVPPSEYMLHAWAKSGLESLTHVLGSALDGEDVYQALAEDRVRGHRSRGVAPYRTRGIVVFSSCFSGTSNDALMFAAHTTIQRLLTDHDRYNHTTNVVLQLDNLRAATTIGPYHVSDAMKAKVDDDLMLAPPFITGKVFSSDMLQSILIHTCVTPHIVPFFERLTNVPRDLWQSAKLSDYDERIDGKIAMTRFRVYSNTMGGRATGNAASDSSSSTRGAGMQVHQLFSEAFSNFLTAHGLLCVGVFRVLPVSGGNARFMITNPPPSLRLVRDDEFYCVSPWSKHVKTTRHKSVPDSTMFEA